MRGVHSLESGAVKDTVIAIRPCFSKYSDPDPKHHPSPQKRNMAPGEWGSAEEKGSMAGHIDLEDRGAEGPSVCSFHVGGGGQMCSEAHLHCGLKSWGEGYRALGQRRGWLVKSRGSLLPPQQGTRTWAQAHTHSPCSLLCRKCSSKSSSGATATNPRKCNKPRLPLSQSLHS